MSSHPTDFQGSRAAVNGGGGHFSIEVTSPAFAGKGMMESQRMVYGVDSLKTRTPTAPA